MGHLYGGKFKKKSHSEVFRAELKREIIWLSLTLRKSDILKETKPPMFQPKMFLESFFLTSGIGGRVRRKSRHSNPGAGF